MVPEVKEDMPKLSPYKFTAGTIGIPILGVVAYFVSAVIGILVYMLYIFGENPQYKDDLLAGHDFNIQNIPGSLDGAMLIYSILQILFFALIMYCSKNRGKNYIFTKINLNLNWAFLPLLMLGSIAIANFWGIIVNLFSATSSFWESVRQSGEYIDKILGMNDNAVIAGITTAILVPFAEEFLFRGIILNELRLVMNKYIAVIITALIFGFFHANIFQGVYAFMIGIVLGLIYIWYESIWAAVLGHAIFNFYGGVLGLIVQNTGSSVLENVYTIIPMVALVLCVPSVIRIWKTKGTNDAVARGSALWCSMKAGDRLPREPYVYSEKPYAERKLEEEQMRAAKIEIETESPTVRPYVPQYRPDSIENINSMDGLGSNFDDKHQ